MTAESEEGAMVCRGATKKEVRGEERGVRHAHCYGSLPSARKLLKSRQRSSARTIESSVERLNGCRATMICRTQEAVGQMDGRTCHDGEEPFGSHSCKRFFSLAQEPKVPFDVHEFNSNQL